VRALEIIDLLRVVRNTLHNFGKFLARNNSSSPMVCSSSDASEEPCRKTLLLPSRDYHQECHFEMAGAKGIYQHLSAQKKNLAGEATLNNLALMRQP
jgi:hypothetical protein